MRSMREGVRRGGSATVVATRCGCGGHPRPIPARGLLGLPAPAHPAACCPGGGRCRQPSCGAPQADGAVLGSAGQGLAVGVRIVFTRHTLPTIRPVNHILDGGDIVIRTHEGAALTSHTGRNGVSGVVVAYEADAIDPDTHLGWSVVVTGYARLVTDPAELERYQTLLRPWARQTMDHAVCIRPDLVTGIRLTEADRPD